MPREKLIAAAIATNVACRCLFLWFWWIQYCRQKKQSIRSCGFGDGILLASETTGPSFQGELRGFGISPTGWRCGCWRPLDLPANAWEMLKKVDSCFFSVWLLKVFCFFTKKPVDSCLLKSLFKVLINMFFSLRGSAEWSWDNREGYRDEIDSLAPGPRLFRNHKRTFGYFWYLIYIYIVFWIFLFGGWLPYCSDFKRSFPVFWGDEATHPVVLWFWKADIGCSLVGSLGVTWPTPSHSHFSESNCKVPLHFEVCYELEEWRP